MKNIFKIHPLTYVVILIAYLTGNFKSTMAFMLIIIVHEFGHLLSALIFKWKIKEVVILPFGGITIFNEILNKPIYQEAIIASMGPLFQLIFTLFVNNSMIKNYSFLILIINLIPIYPLDGSKLLNLFLNKIFPFKLSHKITIYLSLLLVDFCLFFSAFNRQLIYALFAILIIFKLKEEISNHELIYEKFLYERFLYDFKFENVKIIKNINDFYKDHYHYLKKDDKIVEEALILKKKFDFKGRMC